jgi:UDP-N-acetylglucosamine--N-acetylmuramyl-(pentapeptide) pyrophosphoryl-undecaprenol N-acetylglucosamine transferase
MAITVALAGGGTGGHVFPALVIADTIRKSQPAARVIFVGTEHGLESRLVPRAGYPLDFVPARPLAGRGWSARLRGLATLARGTLRARRLLRRNQVHLVIGIGGYASFPVVAAALTLRIPTAILEPNARPGLANRVLGRFARAIFVDFEEATSGFPHQKVHRVGTPTRAIPSRRDSPGSPGIVRLLVLGGSQGARTLNRAMMASLEQLGERDGFRITHQTGSRQHDNVKHAYESRKVAADVVAFLDDVPARLSASDLVVARAGAGTIAEICAAGVPSILVPYPFAANDHQMANAQALERTGGCVVVPDREALVRLVKEIRALAQDSSRRRLIGLAAHQLSRPDAAEQIWKICSAWIPGARGTQA